MRRSLVLLGVMLAACSSEDGAASTAPEADAVAESATTDSAAAEASADANFSADADPYGAYPAGPYGIKEGETLQGLAWEGYVNEKADALSTTKPYVSTSLDKLRRTGKGYGLIHISEYG